MACFSSCPLCCVLLIEFNGVETLLMSEVNLLLEHRKSKDVEEDSELSEVFTKTLEYTQRFSRFKNRETIQAVRR